MYKVIFTSSSGEVTEMLSNASLENAIAFASYLFINTKQHYDVQDSEGYNVVTYFFI